jgi:hypothetical protein
VQWLQNPSQIYGDNLNNVRREISRTFGNEKREYLKEKINEVNQTVRTKLSETYRQAYTNLRIINNLQLTY